MKVRTSSTFVAGVTLCLLVLMTLFLLVTPLSASPAKEANPQRLRTLNARLTQVAGTLSGVRNKFSATQTAIAEKIKNIKPGIQATLTAWSQKVASTAKAAGEKAQATLTAFTSKVSGTLTALPIRINRTATLPADEAEAAISSYASSVLGTTVTVVKAAGATSNVTVELSRFERLFGDVEELAGVGYRAALANGYAVLYYGSGTISGDIDIDVQDQALGAYVLLVKQDGTLDQAAALKLATTTYPALAGLNYSVEISNTNGGFAWYSGDRTTVINSQTKQVVVSGQAVYLYVSQPVNGMAVVIAVVGRGDYAAFVK